MRKTLTPFALSAAFIAAPATAQDTADAAAEAVAEAAEEAVEAAADRNVVQIVPTVPHKDYKPRPEHPREARLKTRRFIKPVDFPIAAWQADETGRVGYVVDVSADGKPTKCTITEGEELARLAAATCPLVMERAEFRPATNDEGENVAATYEGAHFWRKREPQLPQMRLVFQYLHDEKGVSSECEFLEMENLPEEIRKDIERDKERGRTCPGPSRSQQGIPYRDENGVPIAKIVTFTMNVDLADPGSAPDE